jgi:hypothetical protein
LVEELLKSVFLLFYRIFHGMGIWLSVLQDSFDGVKGATDGVKGATFSS